MNGLNKLGDLLKKQYYDKIKGISHMDGMPLFTRWYDTLCNYLFGWQNWPFRRYVLIDYMIVFFDEGPRELFKDAYIDYTFLVNTYPQANGAVVYLFGTVERNIASVQPFSCYGLEDKFRKYWLWNGDKKNFTLKPDCVVSVNIATNIIIKWNNGIMEVESEWYTRQDKHIISKYTTFNPT